MSASNASGMSVTMEDIGKKLPAVLPRPPEPPSLESTMEAGQKIPEVPQPPEPPSLESTQDFAKKQPPLPPEPPSLESTQDFGAGIGLPKTSEEDSGSDALPPKPPTPSLG